MKSDIEIAQAAKVRQITENISGVILAGGANERFGGKNKANTVIGGEKIVIRIINTLEPIFKEIILVTNTPKEFDQLFGVKITGDHFLKVGPLGGIHAAMKASSKEAVFIFACDMPFLNKELIIRQIEFYNSIYAEAVLPEVNNNPEPLHGIYKNLLSRRLEAYLTSKTEYAIRDFLENVDVSFYKLHRSEVALKAFTNINTPEEAQKAIKDSTIQ